jgi:hypothetical protein
MDLVMKERAMKHWKEQAQKKLERQMKDSQNNVISQIEVANAELGQLHTEEQTLQLENRAMKSQMVKQAQRVLANTFVKYYYVGHTRGFEKWKEFVVSEKRKEGLIKKMINHWRMY